MQNILTRITTGKDKPCRTDARVMKKMSSGLRLELMCGLENVGNLSNKKRMCYQDYLNVVNQSKDNNESSSSRS